ncbi:MAG: hypothetical protein ACF8K1_02280, partial [Phycisphaerales bacterium JB047]
LHLSQECNEPAIAMGHHRRFVEDGSRRCVVSSQFEPTGWVEIVGSGQGEGAASREVSVPQKQMGLFARPGRSGDRARGV